MASKSIYLVSQSQCMTSVYRDKNNNYLQYIQNKRERGFKITKPAGGQTHVFIYIFFKTNKLKSTFYRNLIHPSCFQVFVHGVKALSDKCFLSY